MAYHNEHAALIHDGRFDRYRRVAVEPGVTAIKGYRDGAQHTHSLRFDPISYDLDKARAWLAARDHAVDLSPASPIVPTGVRLVGLTSDVSAPPVRDAALVRVTPSKRSNEIPEGALGVNLFVSAETVDTYKTRMLKRAVRDAIPSYLSNRVTLDDGTVVHQGAVRFQHDPNQPIGYVRRLLEYEIGFLATVILPTCSASYQDRVRDRVLTGGSMGFDPIEWEDSPTDTGATIDFIAVYWPELSLVDASSTPGTDYQALTERAKRALGIRSRLFGGVDLPEPIETHQIIIETELTAGDDPADSNDAASPPVEGVETSEETRQAETLSNDNPNDNQEVGMPYPEKNGFIWVDLRPELDFVPETLRFGIEDLATGIIRCGGELIGREDDEWDRHAAQKIGFNMNSGGWDQETVADYVMTNSYWWWDSTGAALNDMPQARAKVGTTLSRIAAAIGFGKTPQERAVAMNQPNEQRNENENLGSESSPGDAGTASGAVATEEKIDMTTEEMQVLLYAQREATLSAVAERITAAVAPLDERLTSLQTQMGTVPNGTEESGAPAPPPAEPETRNAQTPKTPTGAGAGAGTEQEPVTPNPVPSQIRVKKTGTTVNIRDLVRK